METRGVRTRNLSDPLYANSAEIVEENHTLPENIIKNTLLIMEPTKKRKHRSSHSDGSSSDSDGDESNYFTVKLHVSVLGFSSNCVY